MQLTAKYTKDAKNRTESNPYSVRDSVRVVRVVRGSTGVGGIGGLLARTANSQLLSSISSSAHAYYHCDGNGNITALVDTNGFVVARYQYDPYGVNLRAKPARELRVRIGHF